MYYLYLLVYIASLCFAIISISYLFNGKDIVFERKFWNPFFMDSVISISFLLWLIVAFCCKSTWGRDVMSDITKFAILVLIFLSWSFLISLVLRLNLKQRIKRRGYQIKLVPDEFGNMGMTQMEMMFNVYIKS